jgi:signal transduction histidine kinase/PAS domain-containing protein
MDVVESAGSVDKGRAVPAATATGREQATVRLLLIGVPDSVRDTLRKSLPPQISGLEVVAVAADRPPRTSERFHAVLIGAPSPARSGADRRRRIADRFPDTPIVFLQAKDSKDAAFASIQVDPRDEKRLVESVRAALERGAPAPTSGADETALQKSDERPGLLKHATREAAWDWDLRTGRVWRGGAYQELCGYSPDEIPPDLDWWKDHIHPDDRAAVLATFDAALVGDERYLVILYRIRRRDGSYSMVLDRGFVLYDDAFRPERIVGFAREVGLPSLGADEGAGETAPPTETALARLSAIELLTDVSLAYMPLELLLTELLNRLRAAVNGDAAMAHLVTEDRTALYCQASVGIERSGPTSLRVGYGQGILGRVVETGKAIYAKDLSAAGAVTKELREGFRSLIVVPIVLDQNVIGALSVATRETREFRHQDQRLLELVADRVAPTFDRVKLLENVRLERERLEALSRRLVSLQEEERSRVSRELHDEIGQLLTSLRMALQSNTPVVGHVDQIVRDLFTRVRDISMSLRPPMLDDLGLASTLRWHCERFTSQTGVRVQLATSGMERRFPSEVELTVFRIVQEALTNVARHANVTEAEVALRIVPGWLEAHVIDRGAGFDAHSAHPVQSSGLTGMRERASLVGGRLSIHSEPGRGTRLIVRVPLDGAKGAGRGTS